MGSKQGVVCGNMPEAPCAQVPCCLLVVKSDHTIAKWQAQITICQANASETVQVISADTSDKFMLRDGTALDADDELNSPGDARKFMCVTLICAPDAADGLWFVFNETGCYSNGTDAIDCEWTDGGPSD